MSELKPGEYVGEDGLVHRAHLHHSVEHGDGWWWPSYNRVLPDDPDFPAAVEALKALVPEPFEWEIGGTRYRYRNGYVAARSMAFGAETWIHVEPETSTFIAALRYAQERGQ